MDIRHVTSHERDFQIETIIHYFIMSFYVHVLIFSIKFFFFRFQGVEQDEWLRHMIISNETDKLTTTWHHIGLILIHVGWLRNHRKFDHKKRRSCFCFLTWSAFVSCSQSSTARLSSSIDCGENTDNKVRSVWMCVCGLCGCHSVMWIST